MSILISGSRNPKDAFKARLLVSDIVHKLPLGSVVLNGGASGGIDAYVIHEFEAHPLGVVHDLQTDWIAPGPERLGTDRVHCVIYRARWKQDGKAAGILRNLHMLDLNPEMVICLWNGVSPGTRNVAEEAHRRRLDCVVLEA